MSEEYEKKPRSLKIIYNEESFMYYFILLASFAVIVMIFIQFLAYPLIKYQINLLNSSIPLNVVGHITYTNGTTVPWTQIQWSNAEFFPLVAILISVMGLSAFILCLVFPILAKIIVVSLRMQEKDILFRLEKMAWDCPVCSESRPTRLRLQRHILEKHLKPRSLENGAG